MPDSAFYTQHKAAVAAGFSLSHPNYAAAAKHEAKQYVLSLKDGPTPLQARYVTAMVHGGHVDSGAIQRAWNAAHNTTTASLHKLLNIDKKESPGKSRRA